jgi:hypothetical protein
MKCFICGELCVTKYIFGEKDKDGFESIVAVQKMCRYEACGWKSYPMKIPEPI